MSDATPPRLGLLALLCSLGGVVAYGLLWQNAFLFYSGVFTLGAAAVGLLLALRAWRRGGLLNRVSAGLAGVLSLAFFAFFFVLARLPAAEAASKVEQAPAFTLPDHTGASVSLAAELARGPVLLCFYRGHW